MCWSHCNLFVNVRPKYLADVTDSSVWTLNTLNCTRSYSLNTLNRTRSYSLNTLNRTRSY
jgi:hypothetical protein